MNKVILSIIVLSLAVIISGCTDGGTSGSRSDGIVIDSFSVEPFEVDENDLVNFKLDIENMGTTTATCVRADLLGVEGWRNQGSTITANIEGFYGEWDIKSGKWNIYKKFKIDPCKVPGINQIPGVCNLPQVVVDMDCSDKDGCDLDVFWGDYQNKIACNKDTKTPVITKWGDQTMRPRTLASEGRGEQPGDFLNTEWSFTPPNLPEGTRVTYPVTVRVSYLYKTTGSLNIPVLSEDEYDRVYSRGVTVSEPILEDHSDSPVILELERVRSPIVVEVPDYKRGGPDHQFEQLKLRIKNIGSGYPVTGNENGLIVGKISLSGIGAEFEDCLGETGGKEILIDGSKADLIKLNMPSGERSFGCSIRINIPPWENTPKGTISIIYDLRYQYYTLASTNVVVEGRADFR